MMRPNLRSRMLSITCRVMLNSEPRLVLITALAFQAGHQDPSRGALSRASAPSRYQYVRI